MKTAVEYTDVIEAKKSPFKDVVAIDVLSVDPPGEIEQQFMENFFKKLTFL